MDIVLSELVSRGYECQQMSGDASSHGTPEKHKRVYLGGALAVASSHFDFLEH